MLLEAQDELDFPRDFAPGVSVHAGFGIIFMPTAELGVSAAYRPARLKRLASLSRLTSLPPLLGKLRWRAPGVIPERGVGVAEGPRGVYVAEPGRGLE